MLGMLSVVFATFRYSPLQWTRLDRKAQAKAVVGHGTRSGGPSASPQHTSTMRRAQGSSRQGMPVQRRDLLPCCIAGRLGFHVSSEPPSDALVDREVWVPRADASAARGAVLGHGLGGPTNVRESPHRPPAVELVRGGSCLATAAGATLLAGGLNVDLAGPCSAPTGCVRPPSGLLNDQPVALGRTKEQSSIHGNLIARQHDCNLSLFSYWQDLTQKDRAVQDPCCSAFAGPPKSLVRSRGELNPGRIT